MPDPFDIWVDVAGEPGAAVDIYNPASVTLVTLRLAVLANDFDEIPEREPITGGAGYLHEDPILRRIARCELHPFTLDVGVWDETKRRALAAWRACPHKWVLDSNAPRYLDHYADWFDPLNPWKVALFAYSTAHNKKSKTRTCSIELRGVEQGD